MRCLNVEKSNEDFYLMINKQNGIALYYQIIEVIRKKIQSGEWKTGHKLPSEPELAQQFGVSRTTVRQATSELVQKGMLVRKHGSGTYVARPSLEEDFVTLSYPIELGGGHKLIESKETTCPKNIAEIHGLSTDLFINEIIFHRYLSDGSIAGVEKYYVKNEQHHNFESYYIEGKMKDYLEKEFMLDITRIKNSLTPILLLEEEAKVFGEQEGSPALEVIRIYYTYKDMPILVLRNIIRSSVCKHLIVS